MDEIAQASLAAMERALAHLQEANKRLAILLALSWLVVAFMVGGVLYFVTHFDFAAPNAHLHAHIEQD